MCFGQGHEKGYCGGREPDMDGGMAVMMGSIVQTKEFVGPVGDRVASSSACSSVDGSSRKTPAKTSAWLPF